MAASNLRKFVHLDLKGGAPKLSYLLSLLPVMKKCGASGLLIEYENVFPFNDRLSALAADWAYSENEIDRLLQACEALSLEVIPLVQTFGHAEFILQHGQFRHLREHDDFPNCFCPTHTETLSVIEAMVAQVLNAHPAAAYFHIGCDEVSPLGVCPLCTERMRRTDCDKEDLFLEHVSQVAQIVKKLRPTVNLIIWDDMIRRLTPGKLRKSDLCALVEPMVWYYGAESIPDVLGTYSRLFPRVWCASAFKGASGCAETLPNMGLHISNTKLWFSVIQDLTSKGVQIAGIALTGWSRYDYFGVLCELLPAGIPSLVVCLRILASGHGWTQEMHLEASRLLGVEYCIPIEWQPRPKPLIVDLQFPGSLVFIGSQCQANLYNRFIGFVNSDLYRGWLNKHNVARGYANVGTARQLTIEAQMLLDEFIQLKEKMSLPMHEIFPSSVVEEWVGEHVDVFARKLEIMIERVSKILR